MFPYKIWGKSTKKKVGTIPLKPIPKVYIYCTIQQKSSRTQCIFMDKKKAPTKALNSIWTSLWNLTLKVHRSIIKSFSTIRATLKHGPLLICPWWYPPLASPFSSTLPICLQWTGYIRTHPNISTTPDTSYSNVSQWGPHRWRPW